MRRYDILATYFRTWSGVDIFFVISGFVIARSALPTFFAARSNRAFADATLTFWIRRAWRLIPSAWLWLVLIQVLSFFFNYSFAFGLPKTNFAALVAGVLNIANFRFMETFGRVDYGTSFPYWSLSLEEQFYLILPVLIFVFRRRVLAFVLPVILVQWLLPREVLVSPVRTDGLFLGVLLAMWASHPTYRRAEPTFLQKSTVLRLAVVVALVVGLAAVSARDLHVHSRLSALVTIISGALVFLASFDKDYIMPPGAAKRVMLWIGSRSYALYLVHIPVFCVTREIWYRIEPKGTIFDGTFTVAYAITGVILLTMVSDLNYRFVEVPFRRRGVALAERFRQHRAERAAIATQNGALPRAKIAHRTGQRVVWPWVLTSWVALLGIAAVGRDGRFDRAVVVPPIAIGEDIAQYPVFEHVAVQGWGPREPWGIWTTANVGIIEIPMPQGFHHPPRLYLKGLMLLTDKRPKGTMTLFADGVEIGRFSLTVADHELEAVVGLPQELVPPVHRLQLRIVVDQTASPKALGLSADARELGFGLVSMRLQGD